MTMCALNEVKGMGGTMKKIFITLIVIILISLFGFAIYKKVYLDDSDSKKSTSKNKENEEEKDDILEKYKGLLFEDYYEDALSTVNDMSLEEKVGQIFFVRYDVNSIESDKEYYPGGYILFAKDLENHTKESIKEEIENDQRINKYPLLIAVDEEGGTVTRVSRFKQFRSEKFPSAQDIYNEGGFDLLAAIEKEKAELLLSLGINTNLAPVADVSTDPNDFIYARSFGKSAEETATYVEKMVEYSKDNKINACLKHFPGYGNNVDTHTGVAIDNRDYNNFINNDFLPFKAGIESGVPSILVSHNIVTAIDSEYPSSLSKKVISELRNTLDFSGIIMTDDLAMDAVKSYVENGSAAVLALQAGNDMIITSDFKTMYDEVLNAVKSGTIKEEVLNEAVLRITAWKYKTGLY